MMKWRFAATILSFVLLVFAGAADAAGPSYTQRELQIKTDLVYSSSAREAALKRQYSATLYNRDQKITAKQRELTATRAQNATLRTGQQQAMTRAAALETEILDLKRQQNEELAQKDLEFARMRASLEAVAHDLMRSPEGRQALDVYLARGPGSAELAIDILQRATVKRNVEDLRDTAYFALDAQVQGRVPTPTVIALFEAVVAVDAGEFFDWLELESLYERVGDRDKQQWAANEALRTAQTDVEDAMALNRLAWLDINRGNFAEAQKKYTEVLELNRFLAGQSIDGRPRMTVPADELSSARNGLTSIALSNGDLAKARRMLHETLKELEDEMNRFPESLVAKAKAAAFMLAAGRFDAMDDQMHEAWGHSDTSLKLADELADQYPEAPIFRQMVADALYSTATLMAEDGNHEEAIARLDEAVYNYDQLARADPETIALPLKVAESLAVLGVIKGDAGDLDGAAKAINDSLVVLRQLANDFPTNSDVKAQRAETITARAALEFERGQKNEGIVSAKEALTIYRDLAKGHDDDAVAQYDITKAMAVLAKMNAPGYSWSNVATRLQQIGARRALLPSETRLLEKARQNAAPKANGLYRQ